MKATRVILAAAAAVLLAAPAMAAETAKTPAKTPGMVKKWDVLDTDKDGFVSKKEWAAEGERMFDKRDADHDGKLSKDEWQHKRVEHRLKKTERKKSGREDHPAAAAPAAGETAPAGDAAE